MCNEQSERDGLALRRGGVYNPGMTKRILSWTLLMAMGMAGCGDSQETPPPPSAGDREEPAPAAVAAPAVTPTRPPHSRFAAARSAGAKRADQVAQGWRRIDHRELCAAFLAGAEEASRQPAVCLTRGDQSLGRGMYEAAIRCFSRAAELDGGKDESLKGLATALTAAGRHAEAVEVYGQLLARGVDDPVSRFNLAVALGRLGRLGEAEAAYRTLVNAYPEHVQGWYNLATVLHAQGELADAREAWQRVLALAGHWAGAHANLGEVLMALGEPEAAMREFASAANLQPDGVAHWRNLATAAESAGQLGHAVAALERAVKLAEDDSKLWRQLGSIRLQAHRAGGERAMLAAAVSAWRRSLELQADQTDLAQWIEVYGPAAEAD